LDNTPLQGQAAPDAVDQPGYFANLGSAPLVSQATTPVAATTLDLLLHLCLTGGLRYQLADADDLRAFTKAQSVAAAAEHLVARCARAWGVLRSSLGCDDEGVLAWVVAVVGRLPAFLRQPGLPPRLRRPEDRRQWQTLFTQQARTPWRKDTMAPPLPSCLEFCPACYLPFLLSPSALTLLWLAVQSCGRLRPCTASNQLQARPASTSVIMPVYCRPVTAGRT